MYRSTNTGTSPIILQRGVAKNEASQNELYIGS